MQNKINQKIPIAKMDELIAAVKNSKNKYYLHTLHFTFDGYMITQNAYFYYVSKSSTPSTDDYVAFTNLCNAPFSNTATRLWVAPSRAYVSNWIYANDMGVYIVTLGIEGKANTYTLTFISDTVTEL